VTVPDRPVLYALFGLIRAGRILYGTLIVLAAAAFAGWQIGHGNDFFRRRHPAGGVRIQQPD